MLEPSEDYPLTMFMGVRDDEYFQTGHRHIEELRSRKPEPTIYLHEATAADHSIAAGDWVAVTTRGGTVKGMAEIRDDMPRRLVRVPHGWWKPETRQGREYLSGAWEYSDSNVTLDDDEYLDREQGVPHLRGIPCSIARTDDPRAEESVHRRV